MHAGTQRVDKQETINSLAAIEENRQGGGKVLSRGRSSPMIIAKWEDLAVGVMHFLLALMANGFISLSSTSMCEKLCLFRFPHCLLRIDGFFLSLSLPDVLFLPRLCSLGKRRDSYCGNYDCSSAQRSSENLSVAVKEMVHRGAFLKMGLHKCFLVS